jgi:hypothetical protein
LINFRFHLVSLVAVFLALAVGIVMGYGVLGQPTVKGLQHRIDTVEKKADAIRGENSALSAQIEQQAGAIDATSRFAVSGRLTDASVLVLAVRGVNEDAITRSIELARQAGADAPGILWLETKWALSSEDDRSALGDVLGTSTSRRNALRDRGWQALTNRLANGPGVGADPLNALVDAGFVAYQAVGDAGNRRLDELGSPDTLTLLVVGTDGSVPPKQVIPSLAQAGVDAGLSLVVGEVFGTDDDPATRGGIVGAIRDDDDLSKQVSTVDDVDQSAGAIAAVLALSDLRRSVIGHYGFGEGASAQAPAWSQP